MNLANLSSELLARGGPLAHLREIAIVTSGYLLFMSVRKVLVSDIEDIAVENAGRLIAFETSRGFFWEPQLQEWALQGGQWLMVVFNWLYIISFVPALLAVALGYYIFDRDRYFYYRSIVLLSFVVALVVFSLFPLAPPRMMDGFVDSIKDYGPSWFDRRDDLSYYNIFAAMPSLHFAWSSLLGVLLFRHGGPILKFFGVFYPTATLASITITGNHYIMDAAVSAVMIIVTYAIYEMVFRRQLLPKLRHARMIL
jgi:hypothetical protein